MLKLKIMAGISPIGRVFSEANHLSSVDPSHQLWGGSTVQVLGQVEEVECAVGFQLYMFRYENET